MPGNLSGRTDKQTDGRTDGRTDMPSNVYGWSGGPTDPCTGQKRVFQASDGRTDGRTDGQPENIMPPAPKGGGIKTHVNGSEYYKCNIFSFSNVKNIYVYIYMYTFLFRCGALWGVGRVHCGIFDIGLLAHDTPLCYLFLLISVTPA